MNNCCHGNSKTTSTTPRVVVMETVDMYTSPRAVVMETVDMYTSHWVVVMETIKGLSAAQ